MASSNTETRTAKALASSAELSRGILQVGEIRNIRKRDDHERVSDDMLVDVAANYRGISKYIMMTKVIGVIYYLRYAISNPNSADMEHNGKAAKSTLHTSLARSKQSLNVSTNASAISSGV